MIQVISPANEYLDAAPARLPSLDGFSRVERIAAAANQAAFEFSQGELARHLISLPNSVGRAAIRSLEIPPEPRMVSETLDAIEHSATVLRVSAATKATLESGRPTRDAVLAALDDGWSILGEGVRPTWGVLSHLPRWLALSEGAEVRCSIEIGRETGCSALSEFADREVVVALVGTHGAQVLEVDASNGLLKPAYPPVLLSPGDVMLTGAGQCLVRFPRPGWRVDLHLSIHSIGETSLPGSRNWARWGAELPVSVDATQRTLGTGAMLASALRCPLLISGSEHLPLALAANGLVIEGSAHELELVASILDGRPRPWRESNLERKLWECGWLEAVAT